LQHSFKQGRRLQVKHELRLHAAGVTGVPHFVINARYHLSGAQDTATFVEVLSQL
jgi:predicted DsbA family dithiol-disulfide isomerase